jgi:hypothetical protein
MLVRIQNDTPVHGDGKELLDLIESLRIAALVKSVTPDPTHCRWQQGTALGYAELLKEFNDALHGK